MDDLEELEQEQTGEPDGDELDQAGEFETKDGKPYADDFLNLKEDRVAELRDVCSKMDKRDEWARLIEIIRCTLRRYFLIGEQHPTWNADAQQFQAGPQGVTLGDEDENDEQFFEDSINIYKGYHDVFNSVFSQTAAPTRIEPSNRSGSSVKAAKEAEKYADIYEKYNPAKCSQSEVARLMWTDGRIAAITEYQEDEVRCGVDEDGNILGSEITKLLGVLEHKCPIIGDFKDWPYFRADREIDCLVAKHDNPTIAKKIDASVKGEIPNNEIARMSRIAVSEGIAQVSSDTLAYLVTESTYWLRPAAFYDIEDENRRAFWIGGETVDDQGNKTKIEGIAEKGFRVKWVGSVFAGAKVRSMDEQIRVMHTNPGDGNARGSKSDSMIPIQMEFNDAFGMLSELYHKCIPATWINIQPESLAALMQQFARYGEYHPYDSPNGLPLEQNIFQEQQIDVPASMLPWITNLQATLPQQIANIQPAMFGGNMDDQKTAKAYAQAKDMSLGVMAIVWVPFLEFKAGIVWQAARLSAERENTEISVPIQQKNGRDKVISLDTSILGRGGFICKPVTDQNFPESHTDIANKWVALLQAAPTNAVIAQLFTEPDNLVELKDAIGIKLVIKGARARDKQLAEWEMMQADEGPVPDVAATQAKQKQVDQAAQQAAAVVGAQLPPPPPVQVEETSSVEIRLADDHIEEARTCVRILNDPKTLEMLNDERAPFVKDLELHLIAHLKKAQSSGIAIPPDLAGIIPPLPAIPPIPGAAAPGAVPGTPTPTPKPAAGESAIAPLLPPPAAATGGPSAQIST